MKLIDKTFNVKRSNGNIESGFKIKEFDIFPNFSTNKKTSIYFVVTNNEITKLISCRDFCLANPELKDLTIMNINEIYDYFYIDSDNN